MSIFKIEAILAGYISISQRYCIDRGETLYSSQLKHDYPQIDFSGSDYWICDEVLDEYFPIKSDKELNCYLYRRLLN